MWNTVKLRPLLFFLSMEKIANNVKILHKVTHEIIHITLIAETLYGYALYETRTNFNLLRYTEKISKYFEIYARSIFGKIFHAKCSSSFANHFIFLCFLRFHESLPCPPKNGQAVIYLIFICTFCCRISRFVHYLPHNRDRRQRLKELQRGLVTFLVGNESTKKPEERLYEYLEEPR